MKTKKDNFNDIFEQILEEHENITKKGIGQNEVLYEKIKAFYLDAPEEFAMKLVDKVEIKDSYLYQAMGEKKYSLARKLIEKGADVNSIVNLTDRLFFITIWNNEDIESVKLLLDVGADVNIINSFGRSLWEEVNLIEDPILWIKLSQMIVKTGKLKLRENEENYLVENHNFIKAQIDFENKCEADINWLYSKGIGKFDNLTHMLKYYLKGYKENLQKYFIKNCYTQEKPEVEKFFEQNASKVLEPLKIHISSNWTKIMGICKNFKVNSFDYNNSQENNNPLEVISIPKGPLSIIGGFVFDQLCEDILNVKTTGDSPETNGFDNNVISSHF